MDSGKKNLVSWAHSKVPGLDSINSLIRFFIERRLFILFAIAAAVLLFFFWGYVKTFVVMAFFIVLGAVSMIYNRWLKLSLGFEFIMLGLVITSITLGRLPGLVVGILGLLFAEVIAERFTYSTFVSFVGIAVVALIAPFVFQQTNSITSAGIILVIIYDAIIIPGYLMLGSNLGRSMLFVVTHILFNMWVFSFLAPAFFKVLS